jgi:hypothetical protein
MSTLKTNNVQVGQSVTATNNFTIYQPSTPDGTVRIGVGNSGATTADVLTANSSGNVGIGTSTPSSYTSGDQLVIASASGNGQMTLAGADNGNPTLNFRRVSSPSTTRGYIQYDNTAEWMRFATNGSERARIDSSGNLLVGTTSGDARFHVAADSSVIDVMRWNDTRTGSTTANMAIIRRNGATVGSIQTTNVATSYNTSSDYRLKENVQPMTGALAKISALNPCTYNWKIDGSEGEGFIAHELAEVVPQAVSGEKDAVDSEGNIKPQGIDTSFLVATLTAAIQEQQAMIEELRAKVAALETQ